MKWRLVSQFAMCLCLGTPPCGPRRYYVYDGDDLALEVDGSGNLLRQYTYFPGIDRPHSMFDENGTVYYYAADYPGHVAGLFNASGNVANRYRYSPWGEPEVTSEGVANTLRFMGRERDEFSGLYYVRNRWYDPHLGRFISEDPIGLNGGINWYTYAGNSPTNALDPLGLCKEDGSTTVFAPVHGNVAGIGIQVCRRKASHRGNYNWTNVSDSEPSWWTDGGANTSSSSPRVDLVQCSAGFADVALATATTVPFLGAGFAALGWGARAALYGMTARTVAAYSTGMLPAATTAMQGVAAGSIGASNASLGIASFYAVDGIAGLGASMTVGLGVPLAASSSGWDLVPVVGLVRAFGRLPDACSAR